MSSERADQAQPEGKRIIKRMPPGQDWREGKVGKEEKEKTRLKRGREKAREQESKIVTGDETLTQAVGVSDQGTVYSSRICERMVDILQLAEAARMTVKETFSSFLPSIPRYHQRGWMTWKEHVFRPDRQTGCGWRTHQRQCSSATLAVVAHVREASCKPKLRNHHLRSSIPTRDAA